MFLTTPKIDRAAEIRRLVDVRELAARRGFTPNRRGEICCPFHNEKTPSLHLWEDHWYCFGCKRGGSAIDFVMELDHLSFQAACQKLDAMFSLGLYEDLSPLVSRALHIRSDKAQAKRQEHTRTVEELENQYWKEFDVWRALELTIQARAPSAPDEISPEYAEALKKIPQAAQAFRKAEWRLFDALGITPSPEYYVRYPLRGDPADCMDLQSVATA